MIIGSYEVLCAKMAGACTLYICTYLHTYTMSSTWAGFGFGARINWGGCYSCAQPLFHPPLPFKYMGSPRPPAIPTGNTYTSFCLEGRKKRGKAHVHTGRCRSCRPPKETTSDFLAHWCSGVVIGLKIRRRNDYWH